MVIIIVTREEEGAVFRLLNCTASPSMVGDRRLSNPFKAIHKLVPLMRGIARGYLMQSM